MAKSCLPWQAGNLPAILGFSEIKGTTGGFSAYLSRFTAGDELVCVTMLTNKEGVDMTQVARDIAEAYKIGLGSGLNSEKIKTRK